MPAAGAMDTRNDIFLLGVILLPFLLVMMFRVNKGGGRRRSSRIPPGPPSLPVLGSVVCLTNSPANAERVLRRLLALYGPVVSLWIGSQLAIFVADRRFAHAALVEGGAALADRFATFSVLGENENTVSRASYGHVWRLLRRNLVAETLHPSQCHRFAPARAWVRRVLLEKLRGDQPAGGGEAAAGHVLDTIHHAALSLFVLMCFGDCELLDEAAVRAIGAAQRAQVHHTVGKMELLAFLPSITKYLFRKQLHAANAMRQHKKELFVPLFNARREYKSRRRGHGEPAEKETTFEHSYVDTLLDINLPDDGDHRPLTDDEMVTLCSEFLTAGADTTSACLQWIMAEMVKNPDVQEKLYKEIKANMGNQHEEVSEEDVCKMPYLRAVVLEGLRKHPPAHLVLPHKAAKDMEVGGYLIPKGAMVNFMVAEIGRDEQEWEKPMEFMPERFLEGGGGEGVDVMGNREIRMMPFGAGRRICAGLDMAILHLEYFVANMVKEFEWKEVACDKVDMAENNELILTTVMKKPMRPLLVPRKSESMFGTSPAPRYA